MGYVVAVAAVALATWLKHLAQPNIIPANVPILYILAIVPMAIYFGLGPAILTCVLSLLAYDFFFLSPVHRFSWVSSEAPILAIFLLVGVIISLLESNLKRKREQADREVIARKQTEAELVKYHDHLEELVKQRTAELEAEIAKCLKIEADLRASEERWSSTLASVGDAVIATDSGGSHHFYEPGSREIDGLDAGRGCRPASLQRVQYHQRVHTANGRKSGQPRAARGGYRRAGQSHHSGIAKTGRKSP